MNKVIALDIGKVCIDFCLDICPETLGIAPGKPMQEYKDLYLAHETGNISGYNFIESLKRIALKQLNTEEASSIFCSIVRDEIEGIADIVRSLTTKKYRICFFSDTSQMHLYETLSKLSFAHLVTGGVYSFETGVLKPDKKMFLEFEKRYGRPVLYIDDKQINCSEAEKYGWKTYRFDSVQELNKVVQAL